MNKTLLSFLAFLCLVALLPLTGWPLTRVVSSVVLSCGMFFAIMKRRWLFKQSVTNVKEVVLIAQLVVCCSALVVVALQIGKPQVSTYKSITEALSALALALMGYFAYLHYKSKTQDSSTTGPPSLLYASHFIIGAQAFGQAMVFFRQQSL